MSLFPNTLPTHGYLVPVNTFKCKEKLTNTIVIQSVILKVVENLVSDMLFWNLRGSSSQKNMDSY